MPFASTQVSIALEQPIQLAVKRAPKVKYFTPLHACMQGVSLPHVFYTR